MNSFLTDRKNILFFAFLLAMILLEGSHLYADKVILKNGKEIEGRILKEEDDSITLLTPSMSIILQRSDIETIEREADVSQEEVMGDIALEDGRFGEALAYYQAALKTKMNKEEVLEKINRIQKIQEEEIKRRFGRQLKEVDELIKQKNFDQAEVLLTQVLSNLPAEILAKPVKDKMAHLYHQKALEYLNTVDEIKAEQSLKKAISISEDAYEAHFLYANLLSRNPRTYDGAIDHYKRGIEAGTGKLSTERKAHYHRNLAILYEQQRQFLEAIDQHKKTLDMDPVNYPDSKERIVEAYLYLSNQVPSHDYDKKREYLLAALDTDNYSPKARYSLALLYYEHGFIDEAMSECYKLLEIDPRMPYLHYYQAMCYLKKNQYEKAKDALERELAINPNNYEALCAIGDYYLNGGQYDTAIDYYEKAKDFRKEKYRAYIGLARAYRKIEKPKKARRNLDQVFLTNPDHIEATILSGSLFKDNKEYKKARELFNNVVTRLKESGNLRNPEQKDLLIEALLQRGELNLILDSPRIALADFRETLELEPGYAEIYYHMAQANIKITKYKEAENNYFKAQSLDQKNPKYYLGLGILYHTKLKKTQKAVEYYQKYIRLGGEDFEKVNEWIKECGGQTVEPQIE